MNNSPPSPELQQAIAQASRDRYRLLQPIHQNPGRKTFLAQDQETGDRIILKLLTFSRDFDWQDLKLFQREAEILQRLDHPALPQYRDTFEFETPKTKGLGLVQSYIEARSLQEHIQYQRSFSEFELQQIAEQLLDILEYAHNLGIIHRDLKPSNILLGDRSAHSIGQISLIDFGSVQNLAAVQGGTMTVVGTYGYMPPEQFGGRAVPASDLYSLGATLIYLLTGLHPAELPQEDLRLQFEGRVQLSPRWVEWLGRMVEPDLAKRFPSAEVAKAVLQEQMAIADAIPSPLSSYPPPPPKSRINLSIDTTSKATSGEKNNATSNAPSHTTDVLNIHIPQRQLSFGIDAAAKPHWSKSLAVWLLVITLLGLAGITVSSLLSMFVSLFQSRNQLLLALVLCVAVIYIPTALLNFLVKTFSKRPKTQPRRFNPNSIILRFDAKTLELWKGDRPQETFQRHHIRRLERQSGRFSERLILTVRQQTLVIRGRAAELNWLGQVLSRALRLPLEEKP